MEPKSKRPCIDLNTPNMYIDLYAYIQGFPVGSAVKNLPAVQEMQVWSLDWEDPREEVMAINCKNSTDGGHRQATVPGVARESDTD